MNLSQKYHLIFDYKLIKSDYPKWKHISDKSTTPLRINADCIASATKGLARIKREKISKQKLIIAKKASKILSKIPTIKFIGVTGSLAMMNAKKNSDIDLLVITKANTLWTTRLVILVILSILQIPFRRAKKRDEADKLCLNMWLDETDLVWNKKDRNIYTAHEIAQVIPLVNKNNIYEKFLFLNRWVLSYWPYAVRISNLEFGIWKKYTKFHILDSIFLFVEKLAFKLQYFYMRRKITREVITPTRAIFHPNDWGKVVMKKLGM